MEDTLITQEDLQFILKSIQEDLAKEAVDKEKAQKAKAENSESSESSEDSESSKKEKAKAAAEDSCSEDSESSESPDEKKKTEGFKYKKKSEQDQAVGASTVDAEPNAQSETQDLHQIYTGLNQDEFNQHLVASVLAAITRAGNDMSGAWQAYKSNKEADVIKKSEQEQVVTPQEVAQAEKYVAMLESQNTQLADQVKVLEKSQKDSADKLAELTAKIEKLSIKPADSQAVSVKTIEVAPQVAFKGPQDIVKSLAEVAKSESLDEKDREIIGRYTLRPRMTEELKEFFNKKMGTK